MRRHSRNTLLFFVFILVGGVLGGILGEILSQIQGLAWIKMGGVNGYRELFSFTFDPLISTNFIRFGISLTIRINLGNLVGIIVGALLYLRA
ncbi:MAG TPA: hypothetical protein GX527_06585 [Clostridiaceae bacterium]|jgi:hypothetical protein|nr:hypothetical protein [Clostridiaceae bacterium]